MSAREHLHGVVAALHPVVHGVPEGALSAPTPCAEYDVRALVSHLLGTTEALRAYGAGEPPDPDDPWGTRGVALTDDWRDRLSGRLTALADAWAQPEAWEGDALDGALPREMLGRMAYGEVLLHGWDLAVATDQGLELTRPQIDEAMAVMRSDAEAARSQGAFGPEVRVPDDAPTIDKVLGASGRDPDWSA